MQNKIILIFDQKTREKYQIRELVVKKTILIVVIEGNYGA